MGKAASDLIFPLLHKPGGASAVDEGFELGRYTTHVGGGTKHDRHQLQHESLWEKSSTVCNGATIKLVVEVVSTNWRDDYGLKLADYEAMGIEEYWIVDFRALGAARVIGQPKQPTITLCTLAADGYQLERYTGSDLLVSPRFEGLRLTAQDIFLAGTR